MQVIDTLIAEVKLLRPVRHQDGRGFFSEVFSRRVLEAAGIRVDWLQDNHSLTRARGTVRGLHFQIPPHAQAKLVRVVRGAILDVAVDLRPDSASFGRHVAAVLDATTGAQLYIPGGFAHGFCTLEPDTEVTYKVSAYYAPAHDRGLAWDDPTLGIDWPSFADPSLTSPRDRTWPRLAGLPPWFAPPPPLCPPKAAAETLHAP